MSSSITQASCTLKTTMPKQHRSTFVQTYFQNTLGILEIQNYYDCDYRDHYIYDYLRRTTHDARHAPCGARRTSLDAEFFKPPGAPLGLEQKRLEKGCSSIPVQVLSGTTESQNQHFHTLDPSFKKSAKSLRIS